MFIKYAKTAMNFFKYPLTSELIRGRLRCHDASCSCSTGQVRFLPSLFQSLTPALTHTREAHTLDPARNPRSSGRESGRFLSLTAETRLAL